VKGSFATLRYMRDLSGLVALALVLLSVGLLVDGTFYLTVFIFATIHAIAAVGLCLLLGYAGQVSLGQAAFFGIGAYTTANIVQKLGLDPAIGITAAAFLPWLLGLIIARPLLRLEANYLAMATLAFGMIAYILFSQIRSLTGGLDPGIVELPRFAPFGFVLATTKAIYWVCAAFLLLTVLLSLNLINSRVGRALRALHGSEVAAAGLGINVVQYKTMVFAFAAGVTGVAGALYAHFIRSFNAAAFGFNLSIELLMMVIVGSLSTIWGAVFGAVALTVLPNLLDGFDEIKTFAYGAVMTIIILFMPNGLAEGLVRGAMRGWRHLVPK
jgi:branched-chain amino acid transport system permease protein